MIRSHMDEIDDIVVSLDTYVFRGPAHMTPYPVAHPAVNRVHRILQIASVSTSLTLHAHGLPPTTATSCDPAHI